MKGITERQLQAYADFPEDGETDFLAYRDCSVLAREVLRLRAKLVALETTHRRDRK